MGRASRLPSLWKHRHLGNLEPQTHALSVQDCRSYFSVQTCTTMAEHLTLPNGRTLCYALYGAVSGTTVIALHGTPGSHHVFSIADEAAKQLGLRLVAPDRPGCGDSDFHLRRTMHDDTQDLIALADHLELDRFAVLGLSGGGPYAAFAAQQLGERISGLALVSAYAPGVRLGFTQRLLLTLAGLNLTVTQLTCGLIASLAKHSPRFSRQVISLGVPPADQVILKNSKIVEALTEGLTGVTHNWKGMAWEIYRHGTVPSLTRNTRPPTWIWHGLRDSVVGPEAVLFYVRAFPHARMTLLPDAGHYWGLQNIGQVLESLQDTPAQ